MEFEFDPDKCARNVDERGLPFDLVADFDFDTAVVAPDLRLWRKTFRRGRPDRNSRLCRRLHDARRRLRVISFRKANAREAHHYEQARS